MKRTKLTASQVQAKVSPGRIGDGDGLYFSVARGGSQSWVFVYIRQGKRREMGLGSYSGTGRVSLAAARKKADEVRIILGRGGDPFTELEERRARVLAKTFGEVADDFLKAKTQEFRNVKHRDQWAMTLGDSYCKSIRRRPVDTITTDDIVKLLDPVWKTKHETASRLRGRIERVLDFARVVGLRSGDNPARWKGHLEHRFSKPHQKLSRGHHAALPYVDLPVFMKSLKEQAGVGARALEFSILTAARTGEVTGALWSELDLAAGIWTVPAARMKAGREHRVPLSSDVKDVLSHLAKIRQSDFVFPGARVGRPISNATMTKALIANGGSEVTVHGFRSSFRDWVAEKTTVQSEIAEAALAHVVGDETERAYRRGDAIDKRRSLMEIWAKYLNGSLVDNVTQLKIGEAV